MPIIRHQTNDDDMAWPPDDFSGEWIVEWPNGQTKYRGLYLNGKREGACLCFWANGNLAQDGRCLDDECIGVWSDYRENGTKFKETEYYSENNFDVRWIEPDGSIREIQEWRAGKEPVTRVLQADN